MKSNLIKTLTATVLSTTFLLSSVEGWGSSSNSHKKILLSDVKALTLRSGAVTTGRRMAAIPQLSCIRGSAGCKHTPDVVQCVNRGTDGVDIQWECKADLNINHRFGHVEVLCEGYDYPEDPYILKGSCGLEYSLEYTNKGEQQQHNRHNQRIPPDDDSEDVYYYRHDHSQSFSLSSFLLYPLLGAVIYFTWPSLGANIMFAICMFYAASVFRSFLPVIFCIGLIVALFNYVTSSYGTFGGGYTYPTNRFNEWTGMGMGSPWGYNPWHGNYFGGMNNGFGAGAGLGGLLGYLAGSRNRVYNPFRGYGYGTRGYGYGAPSYGYNNMTSNGGFSSSGFSGAASQRSASGFGGTRRR